MQPADASPESISEALARVLASDSFAHSTRLRRFLCYLIQESLAGRSGEIKEYTIGVEVYGRSDGFDPKKDAIVRVEAGRLRAKLSQYYSGAGREEKLRISVPKGSYVPVLNLGQVSEPGRARTPVLKGPRAGFAIAAGLVLAAGTSWVLWRQGLPAPLSLAVRPLIATSGEPGTVRFAESLTDRLASDLSEVESFSVAPRGAAAALHVRAALEGRVEQSGDRIQVRMSLVESRGGRELWNQDLEAGLGDPWKTAETLSALIARTLRVRYAGRRTGFSRPDPGDAEALALYERGRQEWMTQRLPGLLRSVELYTRAARRDPKMAKAYSALAESELFLASLERAKTAEHTRNAKRAAVKAIELDERSSDALAVLGNIHLRQEWDFAASERELRRALDLDPGVSAHERWFAMASALRGHHTAALAELDLGEIVNPRSDTIRCEAGLLLYQIGRLDEALEKAHECLAITPAYATGYLLTGLVLEQQGRLNEAMDAFDRCIATNRNDPRCPAAMGHARAVAGQRAEAESTARQLEHSPASAYSPKFLAAVVHTGLGHTEEAVRLLQAAYQDREFDIPSMAIEPRFKPLRSDERFQLLLKSLGF